MPIFESLVALLTSSTAKSVGKFLFQKIDGYLKKKYGAITEEEKAELERQLEELKRIRDQIESKIETPTGVTQNEVNDLKQRVVDIEELQKKKILPEVLISPELFDKWRVGEPIEDQAFIVKKQLDVLIDKCIQMRVRETKRWELEEVSNNLEMYVNSLIEARRKARKAPDIDMFKQDMKVAEIALRTNLKTAKPLIREYQEMGW